MEEILLQNKSFDEASKLDMNLNWFGYVCNTVIAVDIGLQFNSPVVCPRIHKICNCTDEIKSA